MKIVHLGLKFIFLSKSPNLELCSSSYAESTITIHITIHAADSVLADLLIQFCSAIWST